METPDFLNVLQHFCGTSSEQAQNVRTLKDEFPFSQVLHTLSARVSKDHALADSQKELQLAAVYAADRTVLKEIMETDTHEGFPIGKQISRSRQNEVAAFDPAPNLMAELERLHTLKQNFELLFADSTAISYQETTLEPILEASNEEAALPKSKKERIIEIAKSVTTTESPAETIRGRRRRKDPIDTLIDHIVTSKDEVGLESEKQKEQMELIDQFIRVQPSISGTKEKQIIPEDLSSIKTGEFGDSIVSETLVEILLKQGKKDKAVEVLKKLIWKFPQKKAYFASQIEELRK